MMHNKDLIILVLARGFGFNLLEGDMKPINSLNYSIQTNQLSIPTILWKIIIEMVTINTMTLQNDTFLKLSI